MINLSSLNTLSSCLRAEISLTMAWSSISSKVRPFYFGSKTLSLGFSDLVVPPLFPCKLAPFLFWLLPILLPFLFTLKVYVSLSNLLESESNSSYLTFFLALLPPIYPYSTCLTLLLIFTSSYYFYFFSRYFCYIYSSLSNKNGFLLISSSYKNLSVHMSSFKAPGYSLLSLYYLIGVNIPPSSVEQSFTLP